MKTKNRARYCKIALLTISVIAIISLVIYVMCNMDFSRDEKLFLSTRNRGVTKIYYDASGFFGDAEGVYEPVKVGEIGGKEKSEWCAYDQISHHLKNGFVAAEDRCFFQHGGVNLKRTVSAVINYLFRGKSDFGGSTITQQVIKNISGDSEKSIKRKFDEIIRAIHIERIYSKEEIFEVYLNIVPMGENMFGVGIAAQKYFSKSASDLSISEAATLVGITNAPSKYNPIRNSEECLKKRNVVLGAMYEMNFISDQEYRIALNSPLGISENYDKSDDINSWFEETLCDEICRDFREVYGYSDSAARALIYNGGLSVYTTLDPKIQAILESYFENEENFSEEIKDGLEYSMVITDPNTASLRAIVGGVGKKNTNRIINYATVNRTPGSTLKPLALYAPLINSKRITWSTVFDDVPTEFKEKGEELVEYPKNSPSVYDGLICVADALAYSKNTVAVRLYNILGADAICDNLINNYGFNSIVKREKNKNGGIITDMASSPLALGQLSRGVDLRSLTEAYTAFSSGGRLHEGRSYVLLVDSFGNELIRKGANYKDIISKECAEILTQMLKRVVDIGTASKIRLKETMSVAGKTGTSGGSRDKLFIGYTPYYTAGIWCGYGDCSKGVSSGAKSHLSVWDEIMTEIHRNLADAEFSTEGLLHKPFCRDSGELFSPVCRLDMRNNRLEYGFFIRGTEPRGICRCHIAVKYDIISGRVAANDTSSENIVYVSLLNIQKRDFPKEIRVTDEKYIYNADEIDFINNMFFDMRRFPHALPENTSCERKSKRRRIL